MSWIQSTCIHAFGYGNGIVAGYRLLMGLKYNTVMERPSKLDWLGNSAFVLEVGGEINYPSDFFVMATFEHIRILICIFMLITGM